MKLAVLCPARPNSALLSHFIVRFLYMTKDHGSTELLVLMNSRDNWNVGIEQAFVGRVKFFYEDFGLGRQGLHKYYEELMKHTDADWVALMCEDFDFVMGNWDEFIRSSVKDVDSNKSYVFYPRFTNTGSVCQVLSRGYINTVGNLISEHCSVDSWVNDVVEGALCDRTISPDVKMLVDYTVGGPPHAEIATSNVPCVGYGDDTMRSGRERQIIMLKGAK
jgi:hypothetical protein